MDASVGLGDNYQSLQQSTHTHTPLSPSRGNKALLALRVTSGQCNVASLCFYRKYTEIHARVQCDSPFVDDETAL